MRRVDETMRNVRVMYGCTLLVPMDESPICLWYFVDYIFILIGFMIMIWLDSTLDHLCGVRGAVHSQHAYLLHLLYKIIIISTLQYTHSHREWSWMSWKEMGKENWGGWEGVRGRVEKGRMMFLGV